MAGRRLAGEVGESLIEVIMAVAILGIAIVALLGGLVTTIVGSSTHRDQSSGTAVLLSATEALKSATYVACATPSESTYVAAIDVTRREPSEKRAC